MKWTETITPKQAAEELGVPYHGWMREMDRAWISEDQKYSVMSRLLRTEWGKVEHVTITAAEGVGRSDGSGDIPWAVKMEIKNDLFGEKRVAVEVFPTQDRLVDKVPCIRVDDLADEQIRAYRIADNKVAEASSWNDDVLRDEMDALKALDVDLTDTGFSEVELDGLLREVEDADFEEFFTEPVQQPPKAADAEQSTETQQSTQLKSSQLAVPQQSGSSSSNVRIAENGLRHEAMSGRYIPSREDCERVPSRICSGELLLHPTMANRRNSKMENVPARQRGIYFYARYRSVFKASRLGWIPESVHRLYQPQQRAAFLRAGCGFHRRL